MHRIINLIFICLVLSMHAVESAQQELSAAKKQQYKYISTPRSTRSERGKPFRPTALEELFKHAREGNIERLEEMSDQYGDLDEPLEGYTAIYHATLVGNLESVSFLTCCGAHMTRLFPDSDQPNQLGNDHVGEKPLVESLLDVAIKQGHRDVALFLEQFIPLWLPNGRGELPLCNALRSNRPDIAFALIKQNTAYSSYLPVRELTNQKETVFMCARRLEHHDIADFIELAIIPPSSSKNEELGKAALVVSDEMSLLTSRWVVLPSLCVLTLGTLYIIKTHAPHHFFEAAAQLPLLYKVQRNG